MPRCRGPRCRRGVFRRSRDSTTERTRPSPAMWPSRGTRASLLSSRAGVVYVRAETPTSVERSSQQVRAPRVGRCSDSSISTASGRPNTCAKTAPLPRSSSPTVRSCSSSMANVSRASAAAPAHRGMRKPLGACSASGRGFSRDACDAAEADVAGRGVDGFGLTGGGAVAQAVVRCAQVRASLDHPARDVRVGLARVVAVFR